MKEITTAQASNVAAHIRLMNSYAGQLMRTRDQIERRSLLAALRDVYQSFTALLDSMSD